jgi:formylmethanofuran dehydrogenase subunit E
MRNILSHSFTEYAQMVKSFHGSVAPGVMIGGFMIDLAYRNLPEEGLFNIVCETGKCLPDAVQLLTPCSIGNQWLKIIDVGRYALTFYEKRTGKGVRVYLDWSKLDLWPEIKGWYLKLVTKDAQDSELLLREIGNAGSRVCGIEGIDVSHDFLMKPQSGPISICPTCQEAYPSDDGAICAACNKDGLLPYHYSRESVYPRDVPGFAVSGR